MREHASRIPSLDGLRAISIGMVIFAHLAGTQNFIVSSQVGNLFELGNLGVRVFFVISGFLITHLLLQELNTKKRIHLGKFYLRRTLRIFPPYYVFLGALAILQMGDWIQLAPRDLLRAFTYTSNYYPERSWYTGHTWSLAVEEQFYLLWPAVLFVAGKGRALWAAFSVVLLSPVIRLGLFYLGVEGVGHRFETIADSIAVGCVLAAAHEWLRSQRLYRSILESRWFALVTVAAFLANLFHEHARLHILFNFTIMNIGIAACIDWCVTYPSGKIGKFLNCKPLVFIGETSYSIYLWQQLFLNRYSAWTISIFPVNLALTAIASLASYYFVERPSLRMRQWLETKMFARNAVLRKGSVNGQDGYPPGAKAEIARQTATEREEIGASMVAPPAEGDSVQHQ